MGCWSEFLRCSHNSVIANMSSIPSGTIALLEQHSELDKPYPTSICFEDLFSSFTTSSRIYGYLTPEYLEKWKETFKWMEKCIMQYDPDEMRTIWVLFYCSDEDLVYSLLWDKHREQIYVRKASHLTDS